MTDWRPSSRFEDWEGCAECIFLNVESFTCNAYPRAIPIQIASGDVDHMVLRPLQTGKFIWTRRGV